MYINLMSFNIKHGVDFRKKGIEEINLNLTAEVIKKYNIDIAGLNEVRGKGSGKGYENQAQIIAEKLGYNWYFSKAADLKDGPFGNAIISKYPISQVETIPIRDPLFKCEKTHYEKRAILKATIDIPVLSGGLNVFITHLGLSKAERKIGVNKIKHLIKKSKSPFIIMGDFNMEPHEKYMKPLFHILKDTALAFDVPKSSFPSDKPKKRIDYILVDQSVEICKADIPEITVSDHRPVIAKIWLGTFVK